MNKEKFYLTTAIPYVNASPHLGHALELVQTDAIARFQRLLGKDVFFLTGTDENSLKNVQAAEKAKIKTQDFVDKNAQLFLDLVKKLDISNNDFIRTTEERHKKGVFKLWQACQEDIYKKKYKGLYCLGCEEFKKESELLNGRCPEHPNRELEFVEEENYFFRLSKYEKEIFKIIQNDEYQIIPQERKKEVLSFIEQGLEDFSISRSFKRAKGWGIPVPNDPSQIIYVWFDALANYLTGVGYGWNEALFQKYWPADLHVIGKGILKFHGIYWPAMLLSAKIPLPKKLFVHGYITVEGRKMGKSLGNVVDPFELIQKYQESALRYFLLGVIPSSKDGDFSFTLFEEKYKADLANGLGNLVARVLTMIEKYNHGQIPQKKAGFSRVLVEELNIEDFEKFIKEVWVFYQKHFETFSFDKVFNKINFMVQVANKYIDYTKPWILFAENRKELFAVLYNLTEILRQISILIYPFMPKVSASIRKQLGLEPIDENHFDFQKEIKWGQISSGLKIQKGPNLFPQLK